MLKRLFERERPSLDGLFSKASKRIPKSQDALDFAQVLLDEIKQNVNDDTRIETESVYRLFQKIFSIGYLAYQVFSSSKSSAFKYIDEHTGELNSHSVNLIKFAYAFEMVFPILRSKELASLQTRHNCEFIRSKSAENLRSVNENLADGLIESGNFHEDILLILEKAITKYYSGFWL